MAQLVPCVDYRSCLVVDAQRSVMRLKRILAVLSDLPQQPIELDDFQAVTRGSHALVHTLDRLDRGGPNLDLHLSGSRS
jgi:hypothetical protein